jgi:hypothetical protein
MKCGMQIACIHPIFQAFMRMLRTHVDYIV